MERTKNPALALVIEDFGVEHEQYFPGFGSGKECRFVGIGDSLQESLEDLKSQIFHTEDLQECFEQFEQELECAIQETVEANPNAMTVAEWLDFAGEDIDEMFSDCEHHYYTACAFNLTDFKDSLK